ncbi:transforming growth factor beta activator LRRC32-like [Lampris incognitus]|uniref:transforming growth factor beta activator LRRC32-like n=1 Tax=Lampris incognitus TaxID=2546036 RepID=UPI0024B4BE4D|nr:transforming growth factor beta activator LRRC32-like [Lampris incognitus]
MLRRTLCNLLLLWSLSHDLSITGAPSYHPQEQSWRNQSLFFIPMDLDVALRRLDVSNNFIRELHTLGLPHLQQLDLSNNQLDLIAEGAFHNLARLEELNLSRNVLNNNFGRNSKALQSIGQLKSLDISMNSLNDDAVELYLQNKSSLGLLKLTGNGLTRLTHNLFKESKGLRAISIDNNLIAHIEQGTFEPLRRLEILNLAKNNLAHICDFKLHQVRNLNLSRNSIEFFVTREDDKLYRLEILDLSHNNLFFFPVVPAINRLRYLYLQNNMVGALNSEAMLISEANSLYKNITGEEDNAAEDYNVYSKWRLMPLIYIDLSYNHFRTFPMETLSLLTSLETLNFSYNCLRNISNNNAKDSALGNHQQRLFPSLRYFDLKSNGLAYISPVFLEALTQLETLNLQENSVKPCGPVDKLRPSKSQQQMAAKPKTSCVTFGQIRTLKHLNLKENSIKMIHPNTFEKTSLVSLNIAGNTDMVIPVGALEGLQQSLQSLSISEVNLTSSELSLPCLPALTQLNISNNRLDTIPASLHCSPLRELDIRNNAFLSLNRSLIHDISAHLDTMYISGNSFNCCDTRWLTILHGLQTNLPDINQAKCATNVNNIALKDYLKNPSKYCQFHTKITEVTFGQVIIIFLFVVIILTMLVFFTMKMSCQQGSFMV